MEKRSTQKVINNLIKRLNLPEDNKFSQAWEYEVANSKRICEFISCYEKDLIEEDEKFTLMLIIIDSCNDALEEGVFDEILWERVKFCLVRDINIHKDDMIISYCLN